MGQLSVGLALPRPGLFVQAQSSSFCIIHHEVTKGKLSLSPCPPFEMIFALHRSTFRLTQRQRTLHTCASLESLAILNINASIISVVPKELRSAGPQSSVSYVFFPMAKRLSKSIVRRAVKQLSV